MAAGRRGHVGREFLDVVTIRKLMVMRDRHGKSAHEIESALGLKRGTVERLGSREVVELAQEQETVKEEVKMV